MIVFVLLFIIWCSCLNQNHKHHWISDLLDHIQSLHPMWSFQIFLGLNTMIFLSFWLHTDCTWATYIQTLWLDSDYISTFFSYFILATFWLHSSYNLTTFCLHSDHILTTFWQHSDYIQTTFWPHSKYILVTFWLHSDYILAILWLCSDFILAKFWLHSD